MVNHHRKRQPTPGPDGAEAHGRVGTLDRSDLAAAQMGPSIPTDYYDYL